MKKADVARALKWAISTNIDPASQPAVRYRYSRLYCVFCKQSVPRGHSIGELQHTVDCPYDFAKWVLEEVKREMTP